MAVEGRGLVLRALAVRPKLIICDEPVSALDVSIQAQILNLLRDLPTRIWSTYIFITHDLSVVKYFSDDIAVMYLGQMVEKATSDALFENPTHPYTKALLSAIPAIVGGDKPKKAAYKGEITSPVNLPIMNVDLKNLCDFADVCPSVCNPKPQLEVRVSILLHVIIFDYVIFELCGLYA